MDTNIELIQQIKDAIESDADSLQTVTDGKYISAGELAVVKNTEKSLRAKVFQLGEHLNHVLGSDEEG